MIKNIYLKNYKSFCELNFEIKTYKGSNNIFLIYGENGAGKSNIVSSITLLNELTSSLFILEEIRKVGLKEVVDNEILHNAFNSFLKSRSVDEKLKKIKRMGSQEEMVIEYTLLIDNKEFKYRLVFDDTKIINESLYAPLSKNQVKIYEIENKEKLDIYFNQNLFKNIYEREIKDFLKKYFGKHTLLSIIKYDISKKNKEYLEENMHEALLLLVNYISGLSVLYKDEVSRDQNIVSFSSNLVRNLEKGSIKTEYSAKLDKTEEILDMYYKSLYADIKQVFYKKEASDGMIKYELYIKKIMGGDLIDIPFVFESKGTKKLLELLPFFLKLLNGGIVVIDELELGVHDILISLLIERLDESNFTGQLIATTHNTTLLDIINKNQIYLLDIDALGRKNIYNLRDSGVAIQPNHSVYNNYKKGAFGGVPSPGFFDFDDIYKCLQEI